MSNRIYQTSQRKIKKEQRKSMIEKSMDETRNVDSPRALLS